jgi:hypothetical protein
MSHIRPLPPISEQDSFFTNLGQSVNNNNIVGGNGISVSKGHNGLVVKNNLPLNNTNNMKYRGTFNVSSSYNIYDVVFVDPNITYTNISSTGSGSVNIPYEATASYNRPPICAGLFICCNNIMPYQFTEGYVTGSLLPAYTSMSRTLNPDGYRFHRFNVYYPIYPLIPTSSRSWISQSGFYTVVNQTYWFPLTPYVPARFCYNNAETTMFIAGMVSGSTFDMTKLPYI